MCGVFNFLTFAKESRASQGLQSPLRAHLLKCLSMARTRTILLASIHEEFGVFPLTLKNTERTYQQYYKMNQNESKRLWIWFLSCESQAKANLIETLPDSKNSYHCPFHTIPHHCPNPTAASGIIHWSSRTWKQETTNEFVFCHWHWPNYKKHLRKRGADSPESSLMLSSSLLPNMRPRAFIAANSLLIHYHNRTNEFKKMLRIHLLAQRKLYDGLYHDEPPPYI